MSRSHPPPTRVEQRIKTEARAAVTCLMPRDDDALRRLTTLLIVTGWLIWSIGLGAGTLTKGEVVLWGFTIYELFSFVVVYTFARMHDIEVKRIISGVEPGRNSGVRNYIESDDNANDDSEDDSNGFVFRDSDDRNSKDDQ